MSNSKESKNFLVTGASRGLGAAICRELARLGHRVLATARSEKALEELWGDEELVHFVVSDLSDPEAPQHLREQVEQHFGTLHGLVNNAGLIDPIAPLAEASPQKWAQAIQVNLTAPSLLMAQCLPLLQKTQGRVVNISTGAAVKSVPGWSAYCASKAGFLHLTSVAAQEYPEVAFYSLRPGVIDTEMQREIRESKGMTQQDHQKFLGLKEKDQLEPPEVPAHSAVWLLLHGPHERSGEFIQYTDEHIPKKR